MPRPSPCFQQPLFFLALPLSLIRGIHISLVLCILPGSASHPLTHKISIKLTQVCQIRWRVYAPRREGYLVFVDVLRPSLWNLVRGLCNAPWSSLFSFLSQVSFPCLKVKAFLLRKGGKMRIGEDDERRMKIACGRSGEFEGDVQSLPVQSEQ